MRRTKTAAITIATACLLAGSMAWSQQGPPRGRGGDRQGPPPEAIEACKDLGEGDACSVETPRGKLEGTCRKPPRGDGDGLACVPRGRRGPGGERGSEEEGEER